MYTTELQTENKKLRAENQKLTVKFDEIEDILMKALLMSAGAKAKLLKQAWRPFNPAEPPTEKGQYQIRRISEGNYFFDATEIGGQHPSAFDLCPASISHYYKVPDFTLE